MFKIHKIMIFLGYDATTIKNGLYSFQELS